MTCDVGSFQVLAVDKIFSRHLMEALTKIQERPWREARRGGPINELWPAQHLSPFGIHSRALRIGATVGKVTAWRISGMRSRGMEAS